MDRSLSFQILALLAFVLVIHQIISSDYKFLAELFVYLFHLFVVQI